MALTSNKYKRSSLLGVSSASTEFGYPNSGMLLRHYLSKHRLCVHTWLSEHRRLCPHDLASASNAFGYPNAAACSALVRENP